MSSFHCSCHVPNRCWWSLFYVKKIKIQGGHQGNKTEEWTSAAVVMVRTFSFDWLEAWPEAFGRPLLDHSAESDRKLTNTAYTHSCSLPHITSEHTSRDSFPIYALVRLYSRYCYTKMFNYFMWAFSFLHIIWAFRSIMCLNANEFVCVCACVCVCLIFGMTFSVLFCNYISFKLCILIIFSVASVQMSTYMWHVQVCLWL